MMASKEALCKISFELGKANGINERDSKYITIIEKDLDKLDKVWDKVEELLQDELTSLLREIPYDMLNFVKVRVLSKLKEWLENESR